MKSHSKSRPTVAPAQWPIEEPEKFIAPTLKTKKKTRPSETADTSSEGSSCISTAASIPKTPDVDAQQPTERPRSVKSENFGLLLAMFATPKAHMRAYSWVHFTQAMVDAGCSVTQGSGSAVHFRSPQGVIVFHRPHPEPSIAQEVLIAMGKRLTKRFGWTDKTFCCGKVSE